MREAYGVFYAATFDYFITFLLIINKAFFTIIFLLHKLIKINIFSIIYVFVRVFFDWSTVTYMFYKYRKCSTLHNYITLHR